MYGETCNKMCNCVNTFRSRGCENCCTYGGEDQRKKKAEYLKRHLSKESVSDDDIKEESIKQYHSLCLDFDLGSAITDRVAFQKGAKWHRDRLSTKELGDKEEECTKCNGVEALYQSLSEKEIGDWKKSKDPLCNGLYEGLSLCRSHLSHIL